MTKRKNKEKTVPIFFRAPQWVYERLNELAKEDMSTISYHIRKAIIEYLEKRKNNQSN